MYRVQESSATFLYTHPKPNSMVVASSTKTRRHLTPPDKDSKKVDTYGKRFYATSSLGIKASNYLACMARFVYVILDDLTPFLQRLPEDLRAQALQLQSDGLAAIRQQLNTTKHILEALARTLSSSVAMRRFAWLRTTALPHDTRTLIEDLPYDGQGLFHADTDTTLRRLDKNIKASKALGVSSFLKPYPKRQSYWPWSQRGRSPTRSQGHHTSSSSRSSTQGRQRFQQTRHPKPKPTKPVKQTV